MVLSFSSMGIRLTQLLGRSFHLMLCSSHFSFCFSALLSPLLTPLRLPVLPPPNPVPSYPHPRPLIPTSLPIHSFKHRLHRVIHSVYHSTSFSGTSGGGKHQCLIDHGSQRLCLPGSISPLNLTYLPDPLTYSRPSI